MADIHKFPGLTKVDEPPAQALDKAKDWGADRLLIIGENADGELLFGGSTSDVPWIIYMLERAKAWTIAEIDD